MSPADHPIKHFLVTRDVTRRKTTVEEFGTDYEGVQVAYQRAEQDAGGRPDLEVVLLSADSLDLGWVGALAGGGAFAIESDGLSAPESVQKALEAAGIGLGSSALGLDVYTATEADAAGPGCG